MGQNEETHKLLAGLILNIHSEGLTDLIINFLSIQLQMNDSFLGNSINILI